MIKMIGANGEVTYGIVEFVCDSPDEIESLPRGAEMGSTCIVISTSEVYMKNGVGEWVKL